MRLRLKLIPPTSVAPMPYATPTRDTVIKGYLKDSSRLAEDEMAKVGKGKRIGFTELDFDAGNHAGVTIAGNLGPFKTGDRVYIYTPHWSLPNDLTSRKLSLPVAHFDQVDNDRSYHGPGNRQCNLTSHAMLLDYLLKGDLTRQARSQGHSEPEGLYGKLLYPYGDSTDHSAHSRLLAEHFDITSYWSTSLSPKDVRSSLEADVPVVSGHIYKSSGHIVLTVGDKGKDGWEINDPYGARFGAENYYLSIGDHTGDHDLYSNASLSSVFWEERVTKNPETGWGRIITSVRGKRTSLPRGL